ncbi:MAG: DUF2334 domain-containing protein [Acidimicrobiia bacterium]|nr:DUF2334 domain-containing protein [Acidimicrobiia bacterium]
MGDWLPPGRRAAVCFSIDDVHPGRSSDDYEGGGDLGDGAFAHVERLLEAHSELRVTLFTTADWRTRSPVPTRRLLVRLPWMRDRVHLAPVLAPGVMRLDRHPAFVSYLRSLPRTEVALHGLHHISTGPRIPVEFQRQDAPTCTSMLQQARQIFLDAGLPRPAGMTPPGWDAPDALVQAMGGLGFDYICSARDVRTPIAGGAVAAMSGRRDVPLIEPAVLDGGRLVHLPANFQATNAVERAIAIIEAGGLLSVKAHIVKHAFGHTQLDGLDDLYGNYLDLVFAELTRRYGDSLWWATMGEVADRVLSAGREASGATDASAWSIREP